MSQDLDLHTPTWTEPRTLDEAEARRADTIGKVARIEEQLADEDRCAQPDYEAWRKKARGALRHAHEELTRLNAWLRKARAARRQNLHRELMEASARVAVELDRWRAGEPWDARAEAAAVALDRALEALRARDR